jgi:hypothetical protein
MQASFLTALAVALLLQAPAAARADQKAPAGDVERLHRLLSAETLTDRRELALKDPVYAGERLRTGPEGRAVVQLADGATLTLGEAAVVSLDSLIYDPASGTGSGRIAVLHGAFRMVSGALGKTGAITLETPIATIGIRGTDFWGYQEGSSLSVVLLDDGRVDIRTAGGQITLDAPRDGIVITDPNAQLPAEPQSWEQERIDRAFETVAFPE